MADVDRLLTADICRAAAEAAEPPDFATIEHRGVRRRRTHAVLLAAAAAVVVAVVAVGTSLVSGTEGTAPSPAPQPSISESSSPPADANLPKQRFAALSPEEIRNHPDAKLLNGVDARIEVNGAPGVGARIWELCLDVCRPGDDATWFDGTLQQALEVTHDDYRTSALYELSHTSTVSHAIDDRFVVMGGAGGGNVLVDSEGGLSSLAGGATLPVTEIAGPIVFTGQPYAWVDLENRELHAIEGTGGTWETEVAEDVWRWGLVYFVKDSGRISQHAITWLNPDGTFDVRILPIEYERSSIQMLEAGTPGTMAVVDPGPPGVVHVSTDYGASWQVRSIPPDVERNSEGWLEGSTLPDDWETWPTR